IQDFADIRERGFCYVDKTARIYELISGSGKQFFLSRPRRFGKSLLCSTLKAIFEGKRELFGEIAGYSALAINSLEWEWKKYPVIRIDLNIGEYLSKGVVELYANLNRDMELCAKKYGVPFTGETISDRFARLIHALHEHCGRRVVVIIDEYDKPLLSTLENAGLHQEMRNALKGFYGVLKSSDSDLWFVFITGVTKFSRVSVFSDLNQLVDLTLNPVYSDICGLTQDEVERNFEPEIEAILKETGRNRDEYLENLRQHYNGYRFSEKPLTVYNPFGLLQHFNEAGRFLPYWYETGSPTFLINLIKKQKINIAKLDNMRVRYEDFRKYDSENIKAEPMLYQCGYLTISGYNEKRNEYTLDYPNMEVSYSFANSLMEQYLQVTADRSQALFSKLPDALEEGNIEAAIEALRPFLASIPYDIITDTENYYETVVFLIMKILGLNCRAEVRTADGRIDTLVETENFVYCIEFKLDKSAEEALAQIDSKDYLLPWKGSGKKLFKVGVNFDSKKRNIGDWKYETVDAGL
ncbi:MAG: ATP-binding protein, partial [Chitinispirillales bacterium]|nr:ATP-binding protein [Chitinispirillales bacterium]